MTKNLSPGDLVTVSVPHRTRYYNLTCTVLEPSYINTPLDTDPAWRVWVHAKNHTALFLSSELAKLTEQE